MRHFLGFRALREIQKLMRERGSKCATFAQNHNIWTHCLSSSLVGCCFFLPLSSCRLFPLPSALPPCRPPPPFPPRAQTLKSGTAKNKKPSKKTGDKGQRSGNLQQADGEKEKPTLGLSLTSAATGSDRKFAKILSKSRKICKENFYFISW